MNKYPFTQQGFIDLQSELYQLADAALAQEATNLLSNFKDWVSNHFELSPAQLNDLNGINQETSHFFAYSGSFAVRNRRPLYLEKTPKDPNQQNRNSGEEQGKLIEPKSKLTASSDSEGNFIAGGDFTTTISYYSLT